MSAYIRILAKQDGKSRLDVFLGREHIVVPVVMLVEGVMHAINQAQPELVLEEEFSKQPQGWNGRPVCGGHPQLHGEFVSASITPSVLQAESFGTLFNTYVRDKKLGTEAWIDPVRAAAHPVGQTVLERLEKGEILEISVGVFARTEPASGVWSDGRKYEGIWRDLVPDHLAILAVGDIGACSVADGCGAMRAAKEKQMKGIKERFKEFVASLKQEITDAQSATDGDVRGQLNRLLRAEEPGFLGVEDVISADGKVIYATMPEDRFLLIRRSFSVDGTTVAIGGDREEVQFVSSFEPVAAVGAAPKVACGCSDHKTDEPAAPAASTTIIEESNMTKTDRINALVASKKLGPAITAKFLEGLTEEQLAAVEKDAETATEPKPEEKKPEVPAAAASALTDEDREALRDAHAARTEKRTGFITQIKANKGNEFTDAELTAMDTNTLGRLAKMAASAAAPQRTGVDFSGMGLPRVGAQNQDNVIPPAPSTVDAIKANRAAQKN